MSAQPTVAVEIRDRRLLAVEAGGRQGRPAHVDEFPSGTRVRIESLLVLDA
jgi:hypothetical protein